MIYTLQLKGECYGYKARGKTVNSCIPVYMNNLFYVRVN